MIIPDEIMAAARVGDTQTVERFLDEGGDINAYDARGETLLRECVSSAHRLEGINTIVTPVSPAQVELCRVLVARGADLNKRGRGCYHSDATPLWRAWEATFEVSGGISGPGGDTAWSTSASFEVCQILMEAGADLNALVAIDSFARYTVLAFILYRFGGWPDQTNHRRVRLEMITTLLRAGARLDAIFYRFAWGTTFAGTALYCLEHKIDVQRWLTQDESFIKAKELIVGIQEDGSFKSFMRRPHRSVLRLRSLFARGRATPPCAIRCRRMRCYGAARQDYAMEFLVKQPDNGIVWNILSFWRAST